MKNAKLAQLLKTIGSILLAVALLGMLCVSDVVRLNDSIAEGGNYYNYAALARERQAEVKLDILIPGAEVTEGMEYKFDGDFSAPPADAKTLSDGDVTYTLLTLAEVQKIGGKLSVDKYKAVKTIAIDGETYGLGTVTYHVGVWEQLGAYEHVLLTIAPLFQPLLVLGVVLLIAGIVLGMIATAAGLNMTPGQYLAGKFAPRKIIKFFSNNVIIVLILLFAAVVAILKPQFASEANIRNLLSNTAIRFIIALGVSGCLITKGTDLSAGRVAGLAACLSAILLQRGDYGARFYPGMPELPIVVVLLLVLGLCALIGIINGSIIALFKVPPFIATLGMQTLVYGVCLVYTGASPIGGLRKDYTSLATGYIGNRMISFILLIAVAVGIFMWFLYNKTRHGKYMYAIGGNETAAEVAGINTTKSKILIYMLAAILYGLMGFLSAAKAGGASVNTAQGYELEAIAGCTIGGVSVNGGVGKISGIIIGVLVFEVLKIALQFLGVESSYTYIVQGLVIIIAVALDLRKYLAKK